MTVSHPCAGKHLVFDGKSLHGVPESLARGNGAERRTTAVAAAAAAAAVAATPWTSRRG